MELAQTLIVLIPIGLVGAYRWSVWLFKAMAATLYRPRYNLYEARFSIVCPVYHEPPTLFRQALESWLTNRPAEIIASIYYSDQECIDAFQMVSRANPDCRFELLIREIPDKRYALAQGIEKTSSEIIALVDSDSMWESDVVPGALAPFAEPKIGGVVTRQIAIRNDTLWGRMFDLYLDNRFNVDLPAQARLGGALSCLSGRTAFYRGDLLRRIAPQMTEETFWGQKVISGEDKFLTTTLYREGQRTAYQGNVAVWTDSPNDFATFIRQRLRWARNTFRSDLKALGHSWAWRQPFRAFFMLDRIIATFATLLSPIYLTYLVSHGLWFAVAILIVWWHLGRTIRVVAHLRSQPRDLMLIPLYVVMTFLNSLLKVYALLTMWNQGWLTRPSGKKNKRMDVQRFALSAAAVTTVITVVGMAAILWTLRGG